METETRIAVLSIIVENTDTTAELNDIIHEYAEYMVGRMGIPYHKRGINLISVVMDAPADVISALSGKLGMLPGISTKTIYGKNISPEK